ncbi:MAG: hypothetical protein EKK55_17295 [Rhodocyclaceae bacterium]|nr:MAG: hypothetical protein EKK55_17295 [Rhodocyclaceae bacterium]
MRNRFAVIMATIVFACTIQALSPPLKLANKDFQRRLLMLLCALNNYKNGERFPADVFVPGLEGHRIKAISKNVLRVKTPEGDVIHMVAGDNPTRIAKKAGVPGERSPSAVIGDVTITEFKHTPFIVVMGRRLASIRKRFPPLRISRTYVDVVNDFEMAKIDGATMRTVFRAKRKEVEALVKNKVSGVTRHGRSVLIRLEHPATVNGVSCRYLKLKGVAPKFMFFGLWVRKYTTNEKAITVSPEGEILFRETFVRKEPFGAMSEEAMQAEVANVGLNVGQHVLGVGHYKDGVRFIVYALEETDVRLASLGGTIFLMDTTKRTRKRMGEDESVHIFYSVGQEMRRIHDSGRAHGMLHLGNISVIRDGDRYRAVFRDWETAVQIENDMRGIGWRMVDIVRPIMDILDSQNKYTEAQFMAILHGYFHEIPENSLLMREIGHELFSKDLDDAMARPDQGKWTNLEKSFPSLTYTLKAILFGGSDGMPQLLSMSFDEIMRKIELLKRQA